MQCITFLILAISTSQSRVNIHTERHTVHALDCVEWYKLGAAMDELGEGEISSLLVVASGTCE